MSTFKNKNSLRTFDAQIVKNLRTNLLVLIKKKRVVDTGTERNSGFKYSGSKLLLLYIAFTLHNIECRFIIMSLPHSINNFCWRVMTSHPKFLSVPVVSIID